MLSSKSKKFLYELIKDGVVMIDSSPKNLDARCKRFVKLDIEALSQVYKECFDKGYLFSFDDELMNENLSGDNPKLLIVNIKKAFEDDLFEGFNEVEDVKVWYSERKDEIDDYQRKSLFLAHIELNGYGDVSTYIINEISRVDTIVANSVDERLIAELLSMHIANIELAIKSLPCEFHYGVKLFKKELKLLRYMKK